MAAAEYPKTINVTAAGYPKMVTLAPSALHKWNNTDKWVGKRRLENVWGVRLRSRLTT